MEDFQLFSSLRYDPALLQIPGSSLSHAGWNFVNSSPLYMLDYHRDRMLSAATHWGWTAVVEVLEGDAGLERLGNYIVSNIGDNVKTPLRVRVAITRQGELSLVTGPVPKTAPANLFPALLPPPGKTQGSGLEEKSSEGIPSKTPEYEIFVDASRTARSEYTHFKTTLRAAYDGARQRAHIGLPDLKEVLIVSEEGAVMEGSTTTPYVWREGRWVTPAVSPAYSREKGSGGQNGTSRRWALGRFVKPLKQSCQITPRLSNMTQGHRRRGDHTGRLAGRGRRVLAEQRREGVLLWEDQAQLSFSERTALVVLAAPPGSGCPGIKQTPWGRDNPSLLMPAPVVTLRVLSESSCRSCTSLDADISRTRAFLVLERES